MSDQVNLNKYISILSIFLLAGTTTGFFLPPLPVWDLFSHPFLCLLLLGLWLVQHGVLFLVFPGIMLMDIVAEVANGALMGKVCLHKEQVEKINEQKEDGASGSKKNFLAKTNFAHITVKKLKI